MSTVIAEGFDPYRAWLKVAEPRRPLTAYELLRLPRFEESVEKIRAAAGEQRAAMELHRELAPAGAWSQVHDELNEAIHVLLDADLKVAYDLALRAKLDGDPQRVRVLAPVAPLSSGAGGNGSSVVCNACGAANQGTRKFCSQCGKNLWQACNACGTLSLAGERFCGACGNNLSEAQQQLAEQFAGLVEQVQALRREHRYEQAIEQLSALLSVEHRHVPQELSVLARRLLEEIVNERDLGQARGAAAATQAEEWFAEKRFAEVVQLLEDVPPPFRSPRAAEILQESRAASERLAALQRELADPAVAGRPTQLLARVKQILEIQPEHAQARALVHKLGVRLFHGARQRLEKFRYDDALKILDEIPEIARPEPIVKAREQVEELAWLAREMRVSPVIDAALPKIAQRLARLAPKDPLAAKLAGEVKRRLETAGKNSKFTVPQWAKPPETSPLGPPVQWLTGFRHINTESVRQSEAFVAHPGRYYAACGLALQGLGQAQLQTNLLPADGNGVLARVARMMPRRAARSAWGIDLGSNSVKAVRLVWNEEGRIAVNKVDFVEHRKLLSQALDEKEGLRFIEESLATLRERNDFRNDRVCVGLPGQAVLHRMLRLPALPADKVEGAIHAELRQMFMQVKQELVTAYHLLESPATDDKSRRGHEVVLVIGRRDRLAAVQGILQRVGIAVNMMQSDCLALHNYLAYEHVAAQPGQAEGEIQAEQATALVDVGGDTTSLIVSSPKMVWMQGLGLGADHFTKSLVQEFDLGYAEAEQLKRSPDQAPRMCRLFQALEPVFADFAHEFRTALESFLRTHPEFTIRRVMLVGGGVQLHGLLRYFQSGEY